MLIQNLINDPDQNALMNSSQLDLQIQADLDRLLASLPGNTPESVWTQRLIELVRTALESPSVPDRFTREGWDRLNGKLREPAVMAMALREIRKIGPYLPETVYVEKQSFHPADWYLWSAAACRDDGGRPGSWSAWTLNLSTGAMNGGHYCMDTEQLRGVLAGKKGIVECDHDNCDYFRRCHENDGGEI